MSIEHQALSVRNHEGERLALPKGNKVRMSVYPDISATGYPLACEMKKRLEEIEEEFKNGKNPYRLLFPAPEGGYWWPTSYSTDRFTPAAIEAGWERQTWKVEEGRKPRHQWVHTHHSLRHRFAHDAIEIWKLTPAQLTYVGGWESIAVVFERYYGWSGDILDEVLRKMTAGPPS